MSKRNKSEARKQRKSRYDDNLSLIQKKFRAAINVREERLEFTEKQDTVFKEFREEDKGGLFVEAFDLEHNIANALEPFIKKVEDVKAGDYSAKALKMLDDLKGWLINIIEEWPDLAGEEETTAETKVPKGKNGKVEKKEFEAAQVG